MPSTEDKRDDSQLNQRPKVSVLIPARNEEQYLPSCLAAVNNQDFADDYEVIVVDNGSTDQTAEIAASLGARVVHEAEPGLPRAREAGRLAAKAPILVYIDADTHIPPNYLTKVVEIFAREPQVVSVTSPVRFHDGDFASNTFIFWYFQFYRLVNFLRLVDFIFGGTFALRSEAIARIGGFNVSIAFYGEDADLSKRMKREGTIRYLGNIYSLTSARRYQREGTFTTVLRYTLNYFSVQFCNRPFAGSRRRAQSALRFGTIFFLMFSLFLYAFAFPESELFGKVIYRMHSPDKVVALTFDDGPGGESTQEILRVLREEGVKGTFFLTGRNVDRHPELAAQIVREGHSIGNHSYNHSWSLPFQRRSTVLHEVQKADNAIYRATHLHTKLFRPPHGLRTPWMLSTIREEGYQVIMGDDVAEDYFINTDAQTLAKHVINHVHPNDIVALHDANLHNDDHTETAAEALRIIIHALKHQGYSFVTLDAKE